MESEIQALLQKRAIEPAFPSLGYYSRMRLDGFSGSERCIHSSSSVSFKPQVSEVCGRGKTWQFRVLCFGLTTAPHVFTRVMAPVSVFLHRLGIHVLCYLDDWLILAASQEEDLWARDTRSLRGLGGQGQFSEVLADSISGCVVPRGQDRFTDFTGFADSYEDRKFFSIVEEFLS